MVHTERIIPTSIQIQHEFRMPPEVQAILRDLHNDRYQIAFAGVLFLGLYAIRTFRAIFDK